jgi:tRNA(fMet)-specific endonuclease VapC
MSTEGYLLDTSVASWLWDGGNRSHTWARSKVADLGDAPIFVCPITIGEIEYGLTVSPAMDPARHALVRTAIAEYEVLAIDRHTAQTYGEIRAALFATHSPRDSRGRMQKKVPEDLIEPTTGKTLGIQENDLWIVSVAVQYDLRLITSDTAEGMRRVLIAANYLQRADFWLAAVPLPATSTEPEPET